jgi:hypothetical protein
MTKSMHTVILGLIVGVSCQLVAQADEAGQPIKFSVSTAAQMTDNRDSVDVDEQDNVDIYVRPRLDFAHDSGVTRIDLYYVPSYRTRSEPGDSDDDATWQHDLSLNAQHEISARSRLRIFEQFGVTDDPMIEDGGITRRGDQSYKRNLLEVGLNYDLLEFSNLDITIRNHMKRYDDDHVASLSDEDEITVKAQHRHRINQKLQSLLTLSYSMYSYDDELGFIRDFDSLIGAVGLENAFTPNTHGSISVGWQTREYDDADLDSEGMPYVRASLDGLLNADLRTGVVLSHGVRDSDSFPFSSQEYSDLRGYARATLSPNVMLRGSLTYRLSSYDDEDIATGAIAIPSGDETTVVADVDLTVNVVGNVSLLLGHRYEDIDSDVGQSYTKNTTRIGASLSF